MVSKRIDIYIRALLIMILIPILSIGYVLYTASVRISDTRADFENIKQELVLLEWNSIQSIIYDNIDTAREQSTKVADNIKDKLLKSYGNNKNQLKIDLQSHKLNSPVYKIINENICGVYMNKCDENNRIIVADKSQIIADRGYIASNKVKRDWKTEIDSKKNKELAKNSLRIILNHSNRLCYWESNKYATPLIQIKTPDMASLKSEFIKNGITTLKNYNILVPSYITRDGDIFGVPDIRYDGIRNTNDKIIVIQEFNIYDAISEHPNLINSFDFAMIRVNAMMNENIKNIIQNSVISILIMILSLLGLSAIVIYCIRQRDDINDGDS